MFSLHAVSLKRRIWIAISLITLFPLIVLFYFFNQYYISQLTIIILGLIVFLGWWVVLEVFSSIVKVHYRSKRALETIGQKSPSIPNEVESLEAILNMLSSKVRSSFEQLKEFSQRTEELNREVSKKVFVLSTILHANDLFSKDAAPEEIIQFLAQRLKEILEMQTCFCLLKSDISQKFTALVCLGTDAAKIEEIVERRKESLWRVRKILLLDKQHKAPLISDFAQELALKNIAIIFITSGRQPIGVLGVGNNTDNYLFSTDELDALNLFSQNVALIWEHRRLSVKVEELEILDYLTGLYNEKFIMNRLDEEINRASCYQRPCGFLLMEIANYDDYEKALGAIAGEKLLKKISNTLKGTLRHIDIGARVGVNRLAAIIIEKNKRQSEEVGRNLKERIEAAFKDKIKIYISVVESPLDGTAAQELLEKAQAQLTLKKNEFSKES